MPKKQQIDLTQGPIFKQLLSFSIPIFLGMLIEALFTTVDRLVVGHFVGKDALGAIGVAGTIVIFIIAVSGGLFIGSMVLVSQLYGAKELGRLEKALTTSYFFLFFLSVITAVLGILLSRPMLQLISTPPELLEMAKGYLDIFFLGIVGLYGFFGVRSLSQGLGDPHTPLYFLLFTAVLNIVLDLLFVAVFHWGVAGAAYATVISQFLSFFLCSIYFAKVRHAARLVLRLRLFSLRELVRMLQIGVPAALHFCVAIGLLMVMQAGVNRYGKEPANAYSAISSIESILFLLPMSIGQALSAFAGQNVGAKQLARIKAGLGAALSGIAAYALLTALGSWLGGAFLIKLFTPEASLISIGQGYFRLMAPFYLVIMSCSCLQSFFEGTGKSIYAMLSVTLGIATLSALIYLKAWGSIEGLWLSYALAYSSEAALLTFFYFRNTWQKELCG